MNKCYLFDYEDSFTHNIASDLRILGCEVVVIPYAKIKSFLQQFQMGEKAIFIHGPGPGYPEDYKELFPYIEKSFEFPQIFHVGLCLGHQIFCTLWGGEIERSKHPMHGQRVEIEIPGWSIFPRGSHRQKIPVQRYNSLSLPRGQVTKLKKAPRNLKMGWLLDELLLTQFESGLSYQFHPESVGTSYRSLFFKPLVDFLL